MSSHPAAPPPLPTENQDPWYITRTRWDEWAQAVLALLPRGRVGTRAMPGVLEVGTTDQPTAWLPFTGTLAVSQGRRYRLTFDGIFRDISATNDLGCGMFAQWRVNGAVVTPAVTYGLAWITGRTAAQRLQFTGWGEFDATATGEVTIEVRLTRSSNNGRAQLAVASAVMDDVGPVAAAALPQLPEGDEPQ